MAVDLVTGILPIFIAHTGNAPTLMEYSGTGFIVGKGVLVTCWHVVEAQLGWDCRYAAASRNNAGDFFVTYLSNVQQDLNGTDLATDTVVTGMPIQLNISNDDLQLGESDLWTYGYPFTDVANISPANLRFTLNPRFMRAHQLRDFDYHYGKYGKTRSYELNIAAPRGLSGAPLVRGGSFEVVGVIYGNHDIETIDEFVKIDPDTGERTPEVRRIVSYGLAHHLTTLQGLSGAATRSMPLIEFLASSK